MTGEPKNFLSKPSTAQWNVQSGVVEWRLESLSPGQKLMLDCVVGFLDPAQDVSAAPPLPPHLPVIFKCQSVDAAFSKVDLRISSLDESASCEVMPRVVKRFRVNLKSEST